MSVFYERCDFETLCSLSWLLWMMIMMMEIYVDEFLHAIGDDFDGLCMYWKMAMLIVDDLLLNMCIDWVICSCIHKSDIYIHIGDDQIFISILVMTRILYIYIGVQNYIYICILRWRPWSWPVPHAYRVVS